MSSVSRGDTHTAPAAVVSGAATSTSAATRTRRRSTLQAKEIRVRDGFAVNAQARAQAFERKDAGIFPASAAEAVLMVCGILSHAQ